MKNHLFLFLLFLGMAQVFPQASTSATVSARAKVVEPIRITKALDMSFGNVIGGETSGSVTLTPEGSRVANGLQLSNALPGEYHPAEAVVVHNENKYSISLPQSFTLYNEEDPDHFLIINDFKVLPKPDEAASGLDILKIGATLILEAGQLPGNYNNASGFNVTVSYN